MVTYASCRCEAVWVFYHDRTDAVYLVLRWQGDVQERVPISPGVSRVVCTTCGTVVVMSGIAWVRAPEKPPSAPRPGDTDLTGMTVEEIEALLDQVLTKEETP